MALKRDQAAIIKRITEQMEKAGLDALILTSPHDVFYTTGLCSRNLYRSGKTGATVSVVTSEGKVGLVCSEFEKKVADTVCDPGVSIVAYPVWIYIEDFAREGMTKEVQPDLNKTYRMASEFITGGKDGIKVGAVYKWLAYEAGLFLRETFGEKNMVDCTKVMNEARTVKTPWEIEVLRLNAQAAERVMHKTARMTVPGMTPADVHLLFHKLCLEESPDMHNLSQAHTFGEHFSPAWLPGKFRLDWGDLVRLDGGPYADGYKSDLARTYAVGGKTVKEREELYAALWRGYEYAVQNIGPGVKMCDLFHGIEKAINLPKYVRGHFGHSISCDVAGEEYPFISPKEERVFEPGMIMCIETPFYSSKRHTYNIEDEVLITETGSEWFTRANPSLCL